MFQQHGFGSARRGVGVLVGVALIASMVAAAGMPARAASRVRPRQHFIGVVNGNHDDAVVYVACGGPRGGDRTTTPLDGQTVSVQRVRKGGGDTGVGGRVIWAQFGSGQPFAAFNRYRVAQPIPTTLQVPCEGRAAINFTSCFDPVPCAPDARPDVVQVTFVNLAV